ncbi:MAG: hypothetical protein PHQ72_08495 [Hespellia sp.]|nr:hypothetical protein [Hespellia sp.]
MVFVLYLAYEILTIRVLVTFVPKIIISAPLPAAGVAVTKGMSAKANGNSVSIAAALKSIVLYAVAPTLEEYMVYVR